ncbi:hypothetical protein NLU13_2563 [Sarocladium strictum]|uniref:AMP-dependent synthetase/ligase domain-containing protein n=1 Tax=Sarocladium strictum TaxID=5046 RepID=A0AA39GKR4_SARSR|nr:hypothetical protein NLU13_2563 [Sarocladium strictum]
MPALLKNSTLPKGMGIGETVARPFKTTTEAFYHHAARYPNATAVIDQSDGQRQLTYQQLAARAQSLAKALRRLGVRPGQRIPLVVKRSVEMVVGIWAVLSCGAQYVPLDGGVVPDSSLRHVVEQSGDSIILCMASTQDRLRKLLPSSQTVRIEDYWSPLPGTDGTDFLDLARSDLGCYVIYTSGTTGKPKGVDVTHKNVANLICLSPGGLGVRPGMKVGQVLNISFDMAAWEVFSAFCNGGTLVIRGSKWEPVLEKIDVLICTPTILSKYQPSQFPNIKVVATAGEPSSQNLADLWASHGVYWNCCGPTETTIVNTMSRHVVGQKLSIGTPTPNNTVYILNEHMEPVDVGVPGIMWAGGHGITRGYIGLDEKTRECYIPDKFANDGSMMYKTGDLGQWRPDGSIDILGRADDQVKIKGFRVELDGISSTLASAPGVSRAATIVIDGELHGFVSPEHVDAAEILRHVKGRQPYYCVPSKLYVLAELPNTPNGKIDKVKLREHAAAGAVVAPPQPVFDEKRKEALFLSKTRDLDREMRLEVRSLSSSSGSSSSSDVSDLEKLDLSRDIPGKKQPRPVRGLRHRILISYRQLFSIIWLLNIGALIIVLALRADAEWLNILTAINLVLAIIIRQDAVINTLYTIACSLPRSWPLWIRSRAAEIYHFGGIHSGAGICATAWLLVSTVQATIAEMMLQKHNPFDMAVHALSWVLCVLFCALVGFAYPTFRKKYHNSFENIHRFVGWTALAIFWVRLFLSAEAGRKATQALGEVVVRNPIFWLLIVSTLSVASSWFWLRKVPVRAEVLSDHAVRLHFDYTQPVNGSFTRLSTRPLLEWHSFATIPNTRVEPKGYSVVVSNAGDWTKATIHDEPTQLWVRGLPTCGVMRIATLFNRVVVIATGSGIGPLLGHINQPSCPTQLIWSTPKPEVTFGSGVIQSIRKNIPDAVIHDTKLLGRPDLVRMGYNMAKSFDAEAVIIIANEKITKKVVYGLQTRGVAAYGAIWDS